MVRNSLRGSASSLSLRSSRIDEEDNAATRARVAELEAQLKELRSREPVIRNPPTIPTPPQATTSRQRYADFASLPKNTLFEEFDKHADGLLHSECMQADAAWNNATDPVLKEERAYAANRADTSSDLLADARGDQTKSLFQKYNESLRDVQPKKSLITKALGGGGSQLKSPEAYAQPFCDFLTENPTVFHAVNYFEKKLSAAGFKKVEAAIIDQFLAYTL